MRLTDVIAVSDGADRATRRTDDTAFHMLRLNRAKTGTIIERHPTA